LTGDIVSDNSDRAEIRFTQSARRHWLYVGPDDRGRELEIIALEVQPADAAQPYLLVIHVMPTQLRG
jgi:hypothetical protein